jgi:molybdopterin converting factor small subunit
VRVQIVCFGVMREYLPDPATGNRAELEVGAGSTVAQLMDVLHAPHALAHSVLVDGERGDLTAELHEGAEVTLMPPFAGG